MSSTLCPSVFHCRDILLNLNRVKEVLLLRELDTLAIKAKSDQRIMEQFIEQNEFYIIKCASKFTHRYITKSDDEWSIALLAFHQAVESYVPEKGSFFSFAELVIRRRLIDYGKGKEKFISEISVDPNIFDTEPEDEADDLAIKLAVADQISKDNTSDMKTEIEDLNIRFQSYGFSFFDLTKSSPKAGKTKKSCAKVINYILRNPVLTKELKETKLLPLKVIEKNVQVPRKIIERHRKYIIAAIEILSGEYPHLAEYMQYIREENDE